VNVNQALVVAGAHGVADEFALQTLSHHFESLEDPNTPASLIARLAALGVPADEVEVALADPTIDEQNARRTAAAGPGSVPRFQVRCSRGTSSSSVSSGMSEDLAVSQPGGPTSPAYFEALFRRC